MTTPDTDRGAQDGWTITFSDPRDFCRYASLLIGAAYTSETDALKRFADRSLLGERTFGRVTAAAPSSPPTPDTPEGAPT
jgi:hypothetical protein